jgi:DNA-binding response OmpR family regulator
MARRAPDHIVDARTPRQVSTPLLVVEDDPHLRDMMAMLLEGEGYPVLMAADGLEAVRCINAGRPSLVILDLNLPHLNGDEVGARIRARYGRELPIIVVSASRQGADAAHDLGADYLPKPFDVDTLLTAVWRGLDRP